MRILFVYPHCQKAMLIQHDLKTNGWNSYHTDLGAEAIDLGKLYDYDAMVLAKRVDDMPSLNITEALRKYGVTTPILVVSENLSIDEKVSLLRAGVDVYVSEPNPSALLIAHISSLYRRVHEYNK